MLVFPLRNNGRLAEVDFLAGSRTELIGRGDLAVDNERFHLGVLRPVVGSKESQVCGKLGVRAEFHLQRKLRGEAHIGFVEVAHITVGGRKTPRDDFALSTDFTFSGEIDFGARVKAHSPFLIAILGSNPE